MDSSTRISTKEDSALREVVLSGDWTITSGATLEKQLDALDLVTCRDLGIGVHLHEFIT